MYAAWSLEPSFPGYGGHSGSQAQVKQVSGYREPGHMAVSGRIWDYDHSVTEVTGDRNGDRDGVGVRP